MIRFNKIIENKFISPDLNNFFGKLILALSELYNCVLDNFDLDDKCLNADIFTKGTYYLDNGETVPKELQENMDRQTYYKILN